MLISWLPRLVFFRGGRANEGRRPRLNDFRKFAEVFADVAHILEKLVYIFGVRVERAVQLPGERLELREIPAQFDDSAVDFRTIFGQQLVHMFNGLVCFSGSLAKVIEKWAHFVRSGFDLIEA